MQTITKYFILIILSLCVQLITAQDSIPKTVNNAEIQKLKETIKKVEAEEKALLKSEVEAIDVRLKNGEITQEEAQNLKMEMAKKRALNIENRTAILTNKIALLERNEKGYGTDEDEEVDYIRIGSNDEDLSWIYIGKKKNDKPKHRKYDRRTKSDFVLAFGLNNALIDGQSFDDTPYKIGGSRFFEMGWAWKYRLFKNSNFVRFKYGVSLHINGLKPNDNQYFVKNGNQTMLEEFPESLRKSKLTITNLVFPMHFEFGSSKKIEKETYFRYSTKRKFKIGVGGYAGFNIGTRQKLKYDLDGERIKDKQKRGLNTTDLVYGLSTYVAFGDTALYLKYDLSPIFKNQIIDQNNISLGVRFDMD
ncbi:hypothetical protein [Hyunsoonleella pacifica]|uniref:PorT family protein n=1 Tax=Hyunsoonleella pacifica TaxID=1080224 RepID=A0A4Q9FLC3_9FLAO|nr:hypothetical protein [Hyunsoonleella pacifica]TBN14665.1 hypothetical protein EYD46_13945 [Hyunsoonleella pacifica]GGD15652.1 hypothetical protein GCM10011368_17050 [Hyunsoonleella pacifica]